jgi:hypothetical protein
MESDETMFIPLRLGEAKPSPLGLGKPIIMSLTARVNQCSWPLVPCFHVSLILIFDTFLDKYYLSIKIYDVYDFTSPICD